MTKELYWLDIGALPRDPSVEPTWYWGWETSKDHWNDNAVMGDGNRWKELGHSASDFEDLTLGTTYHVLDTFTTSGVPVTVKAFQWSNGVWTNGGHTTVENGGRAGGSGNEMNVNNVNLDFGTPVSVSGCSLLFGEYGGNVNVEINGDFRNVFNFSDLNGLTIGEVHVTVVNGFGNDKGSLHLTGLISQFAIGGQELWIDPECHMDITSLKNHRYNYRLRVDRYRVSFDFDEPIKIIAIQEVKKRDERTY